MAEIGSFVQSIADNIKGMFSPTESDLPGDFVPIESTELPGDFVDVKAVKRPLVSPTGVESPSGAIELGQEFEQERQARREARHGEISAILGSAFNPEGQFDEEFWRQVDIYRSGALSDKQRKFRLTFPDGDLISVPTSFGGVLLARPDKDSPYKEIGLAPSFVGALVSEQMLGGTVGSFFGPVGTFAGTTLSVLAQTEIEKMRGFGQGELGLTGALEQGGIATAADVAMRGASRVIMGRAR